MVVVLQLDESISENVTVNIKFTLIIDKLKLMNSQILAMECRKVLMN